MNKIEGDGEDENKKKRKKRLTKKELYKMEREEIIDEMNKIIGINKDNNKIYLHELEKNKTVLQNRKLEIFQ